VTEGEELDVDKDPKTTPNQVECPKPMGSQSGIQQQRVDGQDLV